MGRPWVAVVRSCLWMKASFLYLCVCNAHHNKKGCILPIHQLVVLVFHKGTLYGKNRGSYFLSIKQYSKFRSSCEWKRLNLHRSIQPRLSVERGIPSLHLPPALHVCWCRHSHSTWTAESVPACWPSGKTWSLWSRKDSLLEDKKLVLFRYLTTWNIICGKRNHSVLIIDMLLAYFSYSTQRKKG